MKATFTAVSVDRKHYMKTVINLDDGDNYAIPKD